MELNALSSAFDSVTVLVHETDSDHDVHGEGVGNHKRQMKQRVADAGSNERHAEKSQGSSVRVANSWYGFVSHQLSFPAVEKSALSYQDRSGTSVEYAEEWS